MAFSPQIFLSVGDEYDKRPSELHKAGPPFRPSGSKTGMQSLFQKEYLSLATGDRYADPEIYTRKTEAAAREQRAAPAVPFCYTSPSKKGCSGSYWGTFSEGKPFKHEAEFAAGGGGAAEPTPRQMLTKPAKKGGYGYAHLGIGKPSSADIHIPDPYDNAKRLAALEQKTRVDAPPFKAACRTRGTLDESEHGITQVYTLKRPLPPKKRPPETELPPLRPWRPGGRLEIDLGQYKYEADPVEAKEKRMREMRMEQQGSDKAWIPVEVRPTRYLYTKPIRFIPN